MSTISLHQPDHSDALCRRFAFLASSYFEAPDKARVPAAKVPLENLFRLLQMYRYSAFSDERRSGVLALQSSDSYLHTRADEENWHKRIESAMGNALSATFGSTPKDLAIEQIQSSLRWLATAADTPSADIRTRSKAFLDRLTASLT